MADQSRTRCRALLWLAVAIVLAGFAASPFFMDPDNWGDRLVRYSVRFALGYYAIAACLMLTMRPEEWWPLSTRGLLARDFWCAAFLTYLVHLEMAFHFYHHWSHADAVDHTREVSGIGAGIYVSHLFTLLWGLDVAYWFATPANYARRSSWIGWLLHAFMIFIIFNGMVVYECGLIRWAGLALMALLAGFWMRQLAISTPESRPLPAED